MHGGAAIGGTWLAISRSFKGWSDAAEPTPRNRRDLDASEATLLPHPTLESLAGLASTAVDAFTDFATRAPRGSELRIGSFVVEIDVATPTFARGGGGLVNPTSWASTLADPPE